MTKRPASKRGKRAQPSPDIKVLRYEQEDVIRHAIAQLDKIERLLGPLRKCLLESGCFPIWLSDVEQPLAYIGQLSVAHARLTRARQEIERRRRQR